MLMLLELPAPSSPAAIGWVALALAALFVCVNQALTFFDRFKETPVVYQTYVTKVEHIKLEGRVDNMAEQITAGFERLDQKRSVSIAGLHDDLALSTKELRLEIKNDLKGVHDRMTDMLAAVHRMEGKLGQ